MSTLHTHRSHQPLSLPVNYRQLLYQTSRGVWVTSPRTKGLYKLKLLKKKKIQANHSEIPPDSSGGLLVYKIMKRKITSISSLRPREELEPSGIASRSGKWYSHREKQFGGFNSSQRVKHRIIIRAKQF